MSLNVGLCVLKILNYLFISVLLPSSGTSDRQDIYENVLDDNVFGTIVIMTMNVLFGGAFNMHVGFRVRSDIWECKIFWSVLV